MSERADARLLQGGALIDALRAVRRLTIAATRDLNDEQWRVPYHPGIQPVAWDLAHIGWFAEFWLLRGPHRITRVGTLAATGPARFFEPDEHYDSAQVSHPDRWEMTLFGREDLYSRLEGQLEAACEVAAAAIANGDDDGLYFARLALYHECMHHEALLWTRDLLQYPAPAGYAMPTVTAREPIRCDGGDLALGRPDHGPAFAFDNETPPRHVTVAPFSIDAVPVTNARFLEFVEADGYGRPELWTGAARAFRDRVDRRHPERWRRRPDGAFEQRWFDRWLPLAPDEPVCHVSAYEAEAYCRFVDRRLPTAAEWECAARDIDWGHTVWEWTATPFLPYPGFRPGPYTTYSAPWFHRQREMRGGSFAADAVMHDRTYRNFFLPQRTDVFAGFRTAGT